MDKFQVTILGCASAKPTFRHHPSSQVINFRDNLFMIDCGEGTQMQFARMRFKMNRLRHIFISHLHGDHCYGLPGLLSTIGLTGCGGRVTVHLPEEGVPLLKPLIDYSSHDLEVDFAPYRYGNNVIFEDKALTVNTVPLKHRLPTVGFVFREKPKLRHLDAEMVRFHEVPVRYLAGIKAGDDYVKPDGTVVSNERLTKPADPSRTYAYISDTLPLKAVANEVKGADLLYHEATFLHDLAARAKETCHTTALQAATLARDAEVKRLLIGHFSSRYADDTPLLDEARSVFPETLLANEGLTLDV